MIANSRLATTPQRLAGDGYYMVDNASLGLQLTGNLIGQQAGATCKVMVSNGDQSPAPLLSVQNVYGDPHPFVTPPGVRAAMLSILDTSAAPNIRAVSPPLDPAAANLIVSMLRAAASSSAPTRQHGAAR